MLSPYRIKPSNTNIKNASTTNFYNNSHTNHDVKRPQTSSNDIKPTSDNESVRNKKTN